MTPVPVAEPTYYLAFPILSTLDATSVTPATITLATRQRTACDSSGYMLDPAYAQICSISGVGIEFGQAVECNNAGLIGRMNTSTSPFGLQSSSFIGCAGSMSEGITVSCPTTTYCTFRGISRQGYCGGVGFSGFLNVLNSAWFRSDITQACALYKGSSGLICAGNEVITYTTASPCSGCPTGAYAPSASATCVLCGVGTYLPGGTTSCLTCPLGSTTLASGTGDLIGGVISLPVAQYSASSSSVSTAFALGGAGMWMGATTEYPFQRSWLQMDLLSVLPVKAVVTQGGSASAYVTAIRVDASVDGVSYTTVANPLPANADGTSIVSNAVQGVGGATLYARYIRIYVLAFYKQPGLRAGLKLGLSGCVCMPGYYANVQYPSECALCPVGTFSTGYGQLVCDSHPCPINQYGSSGSTTCTACPSGTYRATTGGTSLTDCQLCAAGTFGTVGGACMTPQMGTFNPGYNSDGVSLGCSVAQVVLDSDKAWCAIYPTPGLASVWMSANGVYLIKTVTTQGRFDADQWVTAYNLSQSLDGISWTFLGAFNGNVDRNSKVTYTVNIVTGWLKFTPTSAFGYPSLRFGVTFGDNTCQAGTYSAALGAVSSATCVSCAGGTYSTTIAASACSVCGVNSYTPTPSSCVLCPTCTANGNYKLGCSGTAPGICTKCTNTN